MHEECCIVCGNERWSGNEDTMTLTDSGYMCYDCKTIDNERYGIKVSGSYISLYGPDKDFFIGYSHLETLKKAIAKAEAMRQSGEDSVIDMRIIE